MGAAPINNPISSGSKDWETRDDLIISGGNTLPVKHFFNEGTLGSYNFYICNLSGSRDIFEDPTGYKIQVKMCVTKYKSGKGINYPLSGLVTLEFKVGNLPLIAKSQKTSEYDDIVTFNFFYQPSQNDLDVTGGKNFWFRKVGGGTVKVVDSVVESGTFTYDETLNNNIYATASGFSIPAFKSPSEEILLYLGNKTGGLTSLKFGNGTFKSGIWKTGVWNDGRRAIWDTDPTKDDIYYFDSLDSGTYQFSPNKWFVKIVANSNLTNVENIQNNIFENDYITIGNLTGIDVNEDRYLLKDYYRVSLIESINQTVVLTVEIPVGQFPLRRFEVDSEYHLIYVTKNIWLGGTFLNGYFRGIWSYGLFKGFPLTTVMEDSHFISGKFDGGRFISSKNTITDDNNISREYQTGLIQNFEFNDRNISETEYYNNLIENRYQSWIDVNYYTQSYVNLNSLTSIYDEDFKKIVPYPNLYGYPTKDVLSSYSKFKNTTDSGIEYYNLGTKYKVYNDFLGENGYFKKAFNSEGKPGIQPFLDAGWSIDEGPFYETSTASFIYNSNIVKRNFNRLSIIMATFGYNILNNSNINIADKRYSVVEYELEYFFRGYNKGVPTNTFQKPINLLGSNYNSYYNIYESNTVKTEYFYNKNALDMILRFNTEFNDIPLDESLYMYGFNFTYSSPGEGETNGSYSTTYSIMFAGATNSYQGGIIDWDENTTYSKNSIVREPSYGSDAAGHFYMSLTGSNTNHQVTDPEYWFRLSVGFNDGVKETGINAQSVKFLYFTSVRIPYFKFYEIDSLPFFNYFKFEINFITTRKEGGNLVVAFTKPHGFKSGDQVLLKLDETKFNPQYETQSTVLFVKDGIPPGGNTNIQDDDYEYYVGLSIPYGTTVSNLTESGTLTKVTGDRIDRRIQTNYYVNSPKIEGLDDNFIYLGSNQVFVNSTIVESSQTS
jgi:hypothetical protein